MNNAYSHVASAVVIVFAAGLLVSKPHIEKGTRAFQFLLAIEIMLRRAVPPSGAT